MIETKPSRKYQESQNEVGSVPIAALSRATLIEESRSSATAAGSGDAIRVALLTGGFDRPYTFGLATALASQGVMLDLIGGDHVDSPEMHTTRGLNFLNLRGRQSEAGRMAKLMRILRYYLRLLRYAAVSQPKIFHILWNNKFEPFDRTLLMLYYKVLRKKVIFTAHNVNAGKRDANDSLLNRLTLRTQYRLCDHIFVHTERMKRELVEEFRISEQRVSVIPFGINNAVPHTSLTRKAARSRLGLGATEKAVLFFGAIAPYKGLNYLIDAFRSLAVSHPDYRLIIAGKPKKGAEGYLNEILRAIGNDAVREQIILKIEYIPDEETEIYFKAADVLALPYTQVFQSGVLFLAYSFGLPVVATNVGSVEEDMIEGRTGFLCRPADPADLERALEQYFGSELFQALAIERQRIRDFAEAKHSWHTTGAITRAVYRDALGAQTR